MHLEPVERNSAHRQDSITFRGKPQCDKSQVRAGRDRWAAGSARHSLQPSTCFFLRVQHPRKTYSIHAEALLNLHGGDVLPNAEYSGCFLREVMERRFRSFLWPKCFKMHISFCLMYEVSLFILSGNRVQFWQCDQYME